MRFSRFYLHFALFGLLFNGCTESSVDQSQNHNLIEFEWISPQEETVDGTVLIRIEADSHAGIETLTLTHPAGLNDTNEAPGIFEANWDSTAMENGEVILHAVAIDGKGRSETATLNLQVMNIPPIPVTGKVQLLNPIQGAMVEIFEVDEQLEPLQRLAQTTTDETGYFELTLPISSNTNAVFIRASGHEAARYDTNGVTTFFDFDDQLTSIIDIQSLQAGGTIQLHAWTTLASRLSQAYAAKGSKWDEALNSAYERMGEHLWRPLNASLHHVAPSLPGEAEFSLATPEAAIGLTHLGLTEIARQWEEEAGFPVKWIDVVTALSLDLHDGYFDGKHPLEVDDSQNIRVGIGFPVHADNTRAELAEAIYTLVSHPLREALVGPNALLATLAKDTGPLYLPEDAPSVASLGPGLFWSNTTLSEGAYTNKSFEATAYVVGPEEVSSLEILSPSSAQWTASDGNGGTLVVDAGPLDDGPVLLYLEAKDTLGNIGQLTRTIHLDRSGPVVDAEELGANGWFFEEKITLQVSVIDALPAGVVGVGVENVILQPENGPAQSMTPAHSSFYQATVSLLDGEQSFMIEATDFLKNTSVFDITVGRDTQPPELNISSPTDGAWVNESVPTIVGEASDTQSGVAQITLINEGSEEESPVTLGEDAQWEGTAPLSFESPGDSFTLRVEAEDAVGNLTETTLNLSYDPDTPLLTIDPHAPVVWTDQESVSVTGTLTDATSGPFEVTATAENSVVSTGNITSNGDWTLTLPTNAFGITEWVIQGADLAGNTSESFLFYVGLDQFPPVVTPALGSSNALWTNSSQLSVTGIATDDGIGVATVFVQVCSDVTLLCSDVVTASLLTENGETEFNALVALPGIDDVGGIGGEGAFSVSVWAEDLLNKVSSPTSFQAYYDITEPSLSLGFDVFYDETEATVSFSAEGNPLYNPIVGNAHAINEVQCAPYCGEFVKFPHRFTTPGLTVDSPKEDFVELNVPIFTANTVDNSLVMNVDASLTIEAQFLFGAVSEDDEWHDISDASFVPVAGPFLWPGLTVVTGDITLPQGLLLRATDLAGNMIERYFAFEISLKTPPLWNVETTDAPLSLMSGVPLDFETGIMASAFEYNGAEEIRVGQMRISNPYPMPVSLRFEEKNILTLSALAQTTGQRTYLGKFEWPEGMPAPCVAPEECQYAYGGNVDETCQSIDGNDTQQQNISGSTIENWMWHYPATEISSVALAGDIQTLAPGESIELNLGSSFAGSCLIGEEVIFDSFIWDGSAYIHPNEPSCSDAILSEYTQDTALCMDQELGPNCLLNPSECLIEIIYSQHFAPVVTALSVTGYIFPEDLDEPAGLRFIYSTPMGEDAEALLAPNMEHSVENTSTSFKNLPGLNFGGE